MVKLTKPQALKRYLAGDPIILTPCKCSPESIMAVSIKADKEPHKDKFDSLVNSFIYYNCNLSETGKYAHYYVKER